MQGAVRRVRLVYLEGYMACCTSPGAGAGAGSRRRGRKVSGASGTLVGGWGEELLVALLALLLLPAGDGEEGLVSVLAPMARRMLSEDRMGGLSGEDET